MDRSPSRSPSLLDSPALLDVPLPGETLFDFDGQAQYGELCFKKGQPVLVFCEDFGEGWILAMLVKDGVEFHPETGLSRGLLPQGFVAVRVLPCDESARRPTDVATCIVYIPA